MLRLLCAVALMIAMPAVAQVTVPPTPYAVAVCWAQNQPVPDAFFISIDGAGFVAVTPEASVNAACPAASTHSTVRPGSEFPPGPHTIQIRGVNAFGQTDGPVFSTSLGFAPGASQVNGIGVVPQP